MRAVAKGTFIDVHQPLLLCEADRDSLTARGRPFTAIANGATVKQSAIEVLLFLGAFAIFVSCGVHVMSDAKYSMLLSENLLRHHTFALDAVIPRLPPSARQENRAMGYPYQVEVFPGKVLYAYPVGSSILSLPFVALMNSFGVSTLSPEGRYSQSGERVIQARLAALLMAVLTIVFLRTALLLLPLSWSLVLAIGGAFGTQVWSTASRVLWSHTWEILLISIAIYMLLAEEEGYVRGRPIVLATLLSWAYFVRPTSSIPIFAIAIYLLIYRCREFVALASTGALWILLFMIYSVSVWGQPLPDYYLFHLRSAHLLEGLAGNLISPSRGLLVYVPTSTFVFWLVIYYWRALSRQALVVLSLSVIMAHILIVSADPKWWGGYCYGARLTIETIPWFFLLAILGGKCLLDEPRARFKQVAIAFGLLTIVLGAAMNYRGALFDSTVHWNEGPPLDVDRMPSRVWDWRHPQFLSWRIDDTRIGFLYVASHPDESRYDG